MRTAVTFTSDQAADYVAEMGKCTTLAQLRAVLEDYAPIFQDALEACPVDDAEFAVFLTGLRKERSGKFAGEEWAERFSEILMPYVALRISIFSDSVKAPWGMVYLRMQQEIARQISRGY